MKLRGGILPKSSRVYSSFHGSIDLFQFAGKFTLRAGGVTHSGGFTCEMWKKAISKIQSRFNRYQIQTCLLLGLGAGTVIHFLEKAFPGISITAVEIDPKMIEIARNEFDIHTNPICADAIDWIQNEDSSFDLIIVDLYIGRFNPKRARTFSFLKRLKKLLSKEGGIFYNSQFLSNNPQEFETFIRNCKKIFSNVEILCEYEMSRLLYLS